MPGRPSPASVAASLLLLGAAAPVPPAFDVALSPAQPDGEGHIPAVDVALIVQGVHAKAGDPILTLPLVANTLVTSAKDIVDLRLADAAGPIAANVRDRRDDGSNSTRTWLAPRAIDGTVTIHYRVPIDASAPPVALPQYEMRTEGGSFSAAANAFLLVPADATPRSVRVHWDFAAYGPGGRGVSSLGVGDAVGSAPLPPERIASTYVMGGRPGIFGPASDGFFAAWQGTPPFDMAPLMRWAGELHRFYGRFFGYTPPSFGVFGRTSARNPGSGIGLTDSFAFTFNQSSAASDLRTLLAHEMLHSWVNSLDSSMDAPDGLDRSWFGEGLAVHYERALPYRAGMISADDFLADLNQTAARYYTDVKIGTPNAQIPEGFWRDTRIRVLPYDRGSLYFDTVDARIRARSGGRRSLDDIVRAMLAARRAGRPMNEALWRSLLKAELGDQGIADFEAMLAGATILPPSDAYGPRFRRIAVPLRRFDLGFDPASLVAQPRLVRGLVAGSNADKAGLRDGDEILSRFPQDALQAKQQAVLTVDVRRAGRDLQISYLPRGKTVPAWQWQRVPGAR